MMPCWTLRTPNACGATCSGWIDAAPGSSAIGNVKTGVISRFGLPSVVLVAVELVLVVAVLIGLWQYEKATTARSRSFQAITALDQMLIALLDVETGMRGYVITGNDDFLVPYRDAIEVVNTRHAVLIDALAEDDFDAEVVRELTAVMSLRLAEAATGVTLRESGDVQAANELVIAGDGRELMESVRGVVYMIRAIEEERLDTRSDRADTLGLAIGAAAVTLAAVTTGVVVWLLVVLRRRQDEESLRRLATAKDEFVGFVSHELRTPIAIIAGNARVLESEGIDGETREDAVNEISLAADRLTDIVDTLLALAKAESGVKLAVEPVLLHRIAGTVRRHHLRRHPLREITITSAPDTPPALGDRVAIEQVLLNLLSNAEKYGAADGPIRITVSARADVVEVAVSNPGTVLDRDAFHHIFEPFFRMPALSASVPGVGLGLTICHRLVAAQGGQMSAEAPEEGGAIFRVELPVAAMDHDE